ncbi:MAG TPA: ribonuclease R [Candidatus Acidoferrum sp.]|nr:ribonuclease R [Candidatus Acidoferrum sp.]
MERQMKGGRQPARRPKKQNAAKFTPHKKSGPVRAAARPKEAPVKGKGTPVKGNPPLIGKYEGTSREFGFVSDGVRRMFIYDNRSKGAMGGDTVEAREIRPAEGGRAAEGEIVRIIARGVTRVIGRAEARGRGLAVVPDNATVGMEIQVLGKGLGAGAGDKVALRVTRYPEGRTGAGGVIERVLGPADEFAPNYEALLLLHGIRTDYPKEAVDAAERMRAAGEMSDPGERRDLTDKLIFTIDGAGAKDFDDAISLEKLPNGNLRLGVHIADVSHYVRPGSDIDGEAKARGTSVYFVDKVVPMLPFALSDDLCSLREEVPRLAMTCDIELTPKGEPVGRDIYRSVIRSHRRCVYEELNALLEGAETTAEKYREVLPALREMLPLAEALNARRMARGAMAFESIEPVVTLDETGKPISVTARVRGVTERLIEEFMLAANEAVAAHLTEHKASCIYRIHERPDPDRAGDVIATLHALGVDAKPDGEGRLPPEEYQRIAKAVEGKPYEQLITRLLIRSMMRAKYSADNLGHYGLASAMYCHFTSPIRRYPDLLVHRALGYLQQGAHKQLSVMATAAPAEAEQATDCEQRATEAERDIEDMYRCLLMMEHIGEEFDGVVSTVAPFGLFIELENTVEGLVHITNLPDDYYEYDEVAKTLTGSRTGRRYRLGQAVSVRLVAADYVSRRIDFELI